MELNPFAAAVAFLAVVAVGVGGLLASGMMAPRIVLMMVLPSMVVFGLVSLLIGVGYGQYRAG